MPRWFIGVVATIAIFISGGGILFYNYEQEKLIRNAGYDLLTASRLKAEQVLLLQHQFIRDIQGITDNPFFRQASRQVIAHPQSLAARQMLLLFNSYRQLRNYRDCLLVDITGKVKFSQLPRQELNNEEIQGVLEASMAKSPVLVETTDHQGNPFLTIVSPLDGTVFFVTRMDPREKFSPLSNGWSQWGIPGTLTLVSRKDKRIAVLNRRITDSEKTFLTTTLDKKEGWFLHKGEHGRSVIVAVTSVPGTSWHLITWVGKEEMMREESNMAISVILVMALLIMSVIAVTFAIWQRKEKQHYRQHYEDLTSRFEIEERYHVTLRSIGEGVIVTDRYGRVTLMNEVAQTLTGWTEEEAIGRDVEEVFHIINERTKEKVENPIDRVFQEGNVVGLANHTALVARDGREIPIADSGAPILDADGGIIGAILVFRDQTEERRILRALHESELWFRTTFYSIGDGVITCNLDGRVRQMNPVAERLTGWAEDEAIGRDVLEVFNIVNEYSRKPVENPVLRVLREGTVVGLANHTVLLSRDGAEYPIADSGSPIMDEEGNIMGVVLIFRNQTEERAAQETLKRSEALLRLIFHTSPDATSLHRMEDGTFVDINENYTMATGYTREDTIGRTVGELGIWADHETFKRFIRQVMKDGYCNNFEATFRRKDGTLTTGILSARVLSINGVPHLLTVTRNIQDLRDMEAEKKKLEERLHRLDKMESLGLLAGGVAHDLNNILGILVGYAELCLLEIRDNTRLESHIRQIMEAGERAATIVQDLLTMARRGLVTQTVLNLNQLITEHLKSLEITKILERSPLVQLEVKLEPELLNIVGSPVHLSKSITNLIFNAMEAMPHGGQLRITTSNCYLERPIHGYDHIEQGDYVLLTVSDTGEGISKEDIGHIFEPFYTKKVMGRSGSGLGLAVLWGTVKDHGGYVDVESTPGEHTTFYLYFPATREPMASTENPPHNNDAFMGKGESILIVDDVKEQRDLAREMLERLNYRAFTVASGEEAVEFLRQREIDLVILDMIMDPGIDGYETYRRILRLGKKQKAIIVSGYAETERVAKARALGVGKFVRKPYILAKIGEAVREELDKDAQG